MDNTVLQEALSALDGKIDLAPSKIPDGKAVVAIELERDETRSGKFVTAIYEQWMAEGTAIAIRNGHVVEAAHIFGRVSNGTPKVTAAHNVRCQNCGRTLLMPLAVWEAKDLARKQGVEIDRGTGGMAILRKYGSCPCGGKWELDVDGEKAELAAFSQKALDAIAAAPGQIPPLMPPKAFLIVPSATTNCKALPPEWEWLNGPLAPTGRKATPFDPKIPGEPIVFNPGFWVGVVDDPHSTGLFWVEGGRDKRRRPGAFNPADVEGL